jgi:hypothetical protein
MLDLKFIRENIAEVEAGARKKGAPIDLSIFPVLDDQRRELLKQSEELKALRNRVSDEISQAKKKGADATAKITEMREVGERIKTLDEELKTVEAQLYQLQIRIPNLPHASVPAGKSAEDNVVVKSWGEISTFAYTPQPHWELNEKLKLIDFDGGAKVAGSFFVNFKGKGAKLARALINFMLDLHIEKHGYTEVSPPVVVNRQSMFGTGQLPKLEDDMYRIEADDLFLIPTAEVPVTNLLANETLRAEDLPIYYTAYTPCFRAKPALWQRTPRFDALAPIRQSRNGEICQAGNELRRARETAAKCRRSFATARPALSRPALVQRRYELRRCEVLRPRSLGAGRQKMAGSFVVLELRSFPGASRQHSFPSRGRWQTGIPPHAQCFGTRAAAHDYRHHGKLPNRRRHGDRAGGIAEICGV